MRVAVISDIHGNLAALDAVLAALDADPVEAVWCLGDIVGYGPQPNECCDLVRERASVRSAGTTISQCGGRSTSTSSAATPASRPAGRSPSCAKTLLEWLNGLAPLGEAEGVALFHGSARDPVWEYVLSDEVAVATLLMTSQQLVLVGHSHVALQVALRGTELEGGLAPAGTVLGLGEARWLLNPGSVGQPRDGDPAAAYLVLDLDARTATYRRVPTTSRARSRRCSEAGLPEQLALRLAVGQ